MTSRIKHLQHAKLYPFTRVANTKSMTPNQLRLRALGLQRLSPYTPRTVFGFQGKPSRLLFFFFFFSFSFFFLEDNIGLHIWVKLTYYGLSTCLRPALQGEKRYIISQPIGTIWCAVCELA